MSTTELSRLVAQKRQVLQLLRDMGRAQLELIRTNDTERLLRVLSAKQPLVNQLHGLEHELEPFRAEDPEARAWASAVARRRCQEDAAVCEGLLAELLELERDGEAAAIDRQEATARQLQAMHNAASVNRAYTSFPDLPQSELDLAADL